jgi:hypothetical protein
MADLLIDGSYSQYARRCAYTFLLLLWGSFRIPKVPYLRERRVTVPFCNCSMHVGRGRRLLSYTLWPSQTFKVARCLDL